jgi:uncharacterized cupredoxin-like copper-binding protein
MRSPFTRRRAIVVSLIALALLVGVVAQAAFAQSTQRLRAVESGGLRFDKSKLTAKAGKVTLVMANPRSDRFPHAIAIEGRGIDKDGKVVRPGGTSSVTVSLKKGTYTFYCPVDGHRKAGMRGTLTVR